MWDAESILSAAFLSPLLRASFHSKQCPPILRRMQAWTKTHQMDLVHDSLLAYRCPLSAAALMHGFIENGGRFAKVIVTDLGRNQHVCASGARGVAV
jgi:hypothetical protein